MQRIRFLIDCIAVSRILLTSVFLCSIILSLVYHIPAPASIPHFKFSGRLILVLFLLTFLLHRNLKSGTRLQHHTVQIVVLQQILQFDAEPVQNI